MQRYLMLIGGVLVALATAYSLHVTRPAAHKIADNLLGETWYRIEMQSAHVGFMHNNAYRDLLGRWHFASTTHFLLGENTPTTVGKHLVFDASARAHLQHASYTNKQNGQTLATTLARVGNSYRAQLDRGTQMSEVVLDWQYALADFVALEIWLAKDAPQAGQEKVAPSADFERLRINRRPYRVLEHNSTGYLVENSAPIAANRIQLNHDYRPTRLHMAGIFQMVATNQADAIALQSLRRKTTYQFPLDRRLHQHTSLASLRLAIDSQAGVSLPREFSLSAGFVRSADDGSAFSGEELRYPITHQEVQRLALQAIAGHAQQEEGIAGTASPQTALSSQHRLAKALVAVTHQRLRYAEDQPAGSVNAALRSGQGECTDYADLYTTLARAAGLPAKTVYGLAYKDSSAPAFVFHAWNEVRVDGGWIAVDPTWNQTLLDATHIPLSDAQAANFMLAHNTHGVSLRVLEQAYF